MIDPKDLQRTNVPGYMKDKKTGTVINTNMDQLEAYRYGKQKAKEINALRNDLEKIKKMLGI